MKKNFIIITLLCIGLARLAAQKTENNNALFMQGGITNNGFNAAIGFERLFGADRDNGFLVKANYLQVDRIFEAAGGLITPERNGFVSIAYRRYFIPQSFFRPYAGIGVLGGCQFLDEANSSGYHLSPQTTSLFGAGAHAGFEILIYNISPFVEFEYFYAGYNHYLNGILGVKVRF